MKTLKQQQQQQGQQSETNINRTHKASGLERSLPLGYSLQRHMEAAAAALSEPQAVAGPPVDLRKLMLLGGMAPAAPNAK